MASESDRNNESATEIPESPTEIPESATEIPDYFTPWSLKSELERNKELKMEDVNTMREFCSSLPDVHSASLTDEILVALLHCTDYDLEKSQEVATKYFQVRNSTPEVFVNRSPDNEEVKNALDINYYFPLPKKTPEGYRLFVGKFRDLDASRYTCAHVTKSQMLGVDATIHGDPTCPGYIFLYDMKGPGIRHMMKMDVSLTRKMSKYMQDAIPLKIKGVYCVNVGAIADFLMRILRPIIKDDLFKLFKFYNTSAWDQFYETIPRELLPEDFHGDLPDLEYFYDLYLDHVKKIQPTLDNDNK